MPVRSQIIADARHRARSVRIEIGLAVRVARRAAGLRMSDVAAAIGRSVAWVSRAERGLLPEVSLEELVVLSAAVGLKLWTATYPAARAIRDAPQVTLLHRFRERIGDLWLWSYEVVVPIAGDRRAADAVIRRDALRIMVEAFTRLTDAQAQLRSVLLKARDLGVDRIVIVVAGTHANRRALELAAESLSADFPLETRAMLRALERGTDPGANGIVLI
jgi:transcriptional regulator with XRE-family HTH domain